MKTMFKAGLGIICMLSTAVAHHEGISAVTGFSGTGGSAFYGWPVLVLGIAVVLTMGSHRTKKANL